MRATRFVSTIALVAIVSGCSLSSPRASQGDIAACVYVQGRSDGSFLSRGINARQNGLPDIVGDTTDGALRGLLSLAWFEAAGPGRDAVLARCRELRAIR